MIQVINYKLKYIQTSSNHCILDASSNKYYSPSVTHYQLILLTRLFLTSDDA